MWKNYLKIAVRNLLRHKLYSLINVSGLAIGMTCFFLIFGFVRFEMGYDRHHEDAERIYRIIRRMRYEPGDRISERVNTGAPLLPLIQGELPGIEHAARLRESGGIVSSGERRFVESRFFFADSGVFEIFTLPLLRGNSATALAEPFSILLTPETARRYFDDQDPLGEVMSFRGRDFKVTGILQKIPVNSHFHVNFLASFSSLETMEGAGYFNNWDTRTWTYVKLRADHSPKEVERGLTVIADRHMDKGSCDWAGLALQPLTEIHLNTGAGVEVAMGQNRDPSSLYTLSALGFIILLIACINFMSLATARSANRAREVGMRKVLGGYRSQLIQQFLGESLLLSGIGLFFAFALVEILLPAFGGLTGKRLEFDYLGDPILLLSLVAAALVAGLVAGSYPAFFLSAFQPAQVIKGSAHRTGLGNWFRKGLVVFQFVLSVILIVSTIVIHRQHNFLTNMGLGFDKENIVWVPLHLIPDRARNYELFKQELLQDPRVLGVTASVNKPGVSDNKGLMIRSPGSEQERSIGVIYVDHDYLETLKIELATGRNFSREIASDAENAILLNESALKELGEEFEMGKSVELFYRQQEKTVMMYDATVIGVVRDFNHRPLHTSTQPIAFAIPRADWSNWAYGQALIRVSPGQLSQTVEFIEAKWKNLFPDLPFRFSFLDQDIEAVYREEERWQTLFTYFTFLALFVACLGLFGLASFTAEQRTKEIGIRKTLGASVASVVMLLSKEFTKLVVVATGIAWPVAYLALNNWLQGYPYRTDLGIWAFLLSGVLVLAIAWLTVGYQALKAALTNPVEALRYE